MSHRPLIYCRLAGHCGGCLHAAIRIVALKDRVPYLPGISEPNGLPKSDQVRPHLLLAMFTLIPAV